MRDFQRERLYQAERKIHGYTPWSTTTCNCPFRFTSLAAVEAFANDLYFTRSAAQVREQFKGPYWPNGLKVTDGRGRRSAAGGGGTILMPRWSRCPMVTAHEVAHNLLPRGLPAHGWQYARSYYRLLTELDDIYGSDLAVRLGTSFEAERVEW
jgi:hypothetical protein